MSYTNYNYKYRRNRISEPSQLLAANDLFAQTVDQKYMLGCIFDLNDGRRFRYQEAGGTLLKAQVCQSAGPTDDWAEMANSSGDAGVVGDTSLKITVSTAVTVDQFADGWLMVQDVTGAALGDLYLIKGNDAGGSGLTPTIQFADRGGLRIATTTSTEFTLTLNKYKDVVIVPAAAATGAPTGVPLIDVTDNYFFWGQTRGIAALIVDTDTVIEGDQIGEPATTNVDGGAGIHTATFPIYGTVLYAPDTT